MMHNFSKSSYAKRGEVVCEKAGEELAVAKVKFLHHGHSTHTVVPK